MLAEDRPLGVWTDVDGQLLRIGPRKLVVRNFVPAPPPDPYVDPTEAAFIRALGTDEDAAGARAVYADWLEERGEMIRADYLRALDSRLAKGAASAARLSMLRPHEEWCAMVSPVALPIERCPVQNAQDRDSCPKHWGALPPGTGKTSFRRCTYCTSLVRFVVEVDGDITEGRLPVVVAPIAPRTPTDLVPRFPRVVGRIAPDLAAAPPTAPNETTEELFASLAALEGAAVIAFERLARELGELGAPASLRERALAAACDETRHARAMAGLARGAPVAYLGGDPQSPRRRTRYAIAHENAVEGCVRETYGALVAAFQAEHAEDAEVRSVFARIAPEEHAHAELSWDVARWIEPTLTADERDALARERTETLAALERAIDLDRTPAERRAGMPSRTDARALLRRVSARTGEADAGDGSAGAAP